MTQWQGLVTSCVSFPELRNASGLLALAVDELDGLLQGGVYPGTPPYCCQWHLRPNHRSSHPHWQTALRRSRRRAMT